jgi:hypothetical protein
MKKIPISQVDVLFSSGIYPVEFLFYYKDAFDTQTLRTALRKLSSAFWPMFGEYREGMIFKDRYREENFYGEEAIDAEIDLPGIEGEGNDASSRFGLPDLKKLFFLKAIRPKRGLILIPKLNHLAGDGYSYFYFLSVLATLANPSRGPIKSFLTTFSSRPHHRRTVLKDFSFSGLELKPAPQDERLTVERVHILRKDVKSLIRDVAASHHLQISTNDVLAATAVKKLVGRPASFFGNKVGVTIPIDVRQYVKEYGPRFFGNGIMLHTTQLRRCDVENSEISEIAIQIRKSMPVVTTESYLKYLTELEEIVSQRNTNKLRVFEPEHGCLVTNLSKLPSDKLDFGTGLPELILPLTAEKNSTAILAKKENYVLRYAY